jgi:hypothetical protein
MLFKWVTYVCGLLLLLGVSDYSLFGQNYKSLTADFQLGKVYAHSETVENTGDAKPYTIQLRYGSTLLDSAFTSLYHLHLQKGFVFNYTDFKLPFLGKMVALAYYLQPTVSLSKNWIIGFTPTAGIAYGTNPYNKPNNYENVSYGTHFNLYVSLGLHAKYQVSKKLMLNYGLQFQHISNGGMVKPNSGVNWYTTGLGIEYKLTSKKETIWLPPNRFQKPRFHVELTSFYSNPKRDTVTARNFRIAGLSAQLMRRGLLHGFSIGTEIANDQLFQAEAKRIGNANVSPWLVSGFAGHEFLFGRVVFSQQLGIYLMDIHKAYLAPWYHRWGFAYYPQQHIGLGINFKIHQLTANFVDVRLILHF